VVDPEHSVFYDHYHTHDRSLIGKRGGQIEGIGRPRVEPSFVPGVIDSMMKVHDVDSLATIHWMVQNNVLQGRKAGPSTGTNLYGALQLAQTMRERNESGSIVTLLCDSGERYLDTYYNPTWVQEHIGDIGPSMEYLQRFNTPKDTS